MCVGCPLFGVSFIRGLCTLELIAADLDPHVLCKFLLLFFSPFADTFKKMSRGGSSVHLSKDDVSMTSFRLHHNDVILFFPQFFQITLDA